MAERSEVKGDALLAPRPECDPGKVHEGCDGPPPTPWLSWKHCFKIFEFREYAVRPTAKAEVAALREIKIRVRFEHSLCPMGRKQGQIVHSLTLLPQEEVRIYEYDRYRRSTEQSHPAADKRGCTRASDEAWTNISVRCRHCWPGKA